MIQSLYDIFGVTTSDLAITDMATHATTIGVAGIVAATLIVALMIGGLLWRRR